jgi:hypothetical protein
LIQCSLLFRWLFIPYIQAELDSYVERINNSKKRADRNKVLPHGVPNDIANSPERYGCLDFKVSIYLSLKNPNLCLSLKVKVDPEAIQYVRERFAPPDDPVFELVPPLFAEYVGVIYAQMGSPEVKYATIWDIYLHIIEELQAVTTRQADEDEDYFDAVDQWQVSEFLQDQDAECEVPYPLIEGRELRGGFENPGEDGSIYLGGVNRGRGLSMFISNL